MTFHHEVPLGPTHVEDPVAIPIDELVGEVPSFENETVARIREELCLRIGPLIVAYPARIGLQTENDSFV